LDAFIRVQKAALGREAKRRRVDRPESRAKDGVADNYKLMVECILEEDAACGCRWDAGAQAWSSRCKDCELIKVWYLYDRGITKEYAFFKCGIQCITPYYKGKNQTCFTAKHTTESRAVATERIPVEQSNRSMRLLSGFHSQCPINSLYLASAEGWCARGLVNLGPRLNNWTENSLHHIGLDEPDGVGEPGDAEIF